MSEQNTYQPTQDANDVDGKEKSIQKVVTPTDVKSALSRVKHNIGLLHLVQSCLENGAVWIWGEMGLAGVTLVNNHNDEPFVFVHWFQNTSGYSIKDVVPYFEEWGRERGATRVATAVDREGPWFDLTGLSPWKLIIAKEIPNG